MEQATQQVYPDRETKEQILEAAAIPCLNCGETLTGKFCNECGQSSATQRLSLREILINLWHSFTETDIGLLHLVKELSYRPGYVTREYIEGKRKKYFNPWSFFILTSAAYVFACSWSGYFKTLETGKMQFREKEQQEAFAEIILFLDGHLKEFNFLFTPILALICWIFYRKAKLNLAEHLVFQAYTYGQIAIAFIVFVLPFISFPKVLQVVQPVYSLASFIFVLVASKQLFQNSWPKTILKTVLLFGLYFALIIAAVGLYIGLVIVQRE